MRQNIASKFRLRQDIWARSNQRYLRLAELDALLDGEFYDCLRYSYYQMTTNGKPSGTYVPVTDRRPSFQFNLFNMLANQIARKLFGGRHAPALVHEDADLQEKFEALKEEADLEEKMIEAVHWGSVGSVATIFSIVPFEKDKKKLSKVVVTNYRAKQCTPKFNKLNELIALRIHYIVPGCDFLAEDIFVDCEGKAIDPALGYWVVQNFTDQEEIVYQPILGAKWDPNQFSDTNPLLKRNEDTSFTHGLGFVPAHWHQYRTGKHRPYDGICYWEPAVTTILDLDYTTSQIGAGVRYNAIPQAVVKGEVLNTGSDGGLGRGAERFIQLKPDMKEGDDEEKNSEVYLLEAKGDGMKVGLENYVSLEIRIAMQQICASLKDPDKVTTAMSGKGMEIIESEFHDLAQELRTIFGNGYLKLLKKIAAACAIKHHALFKGVDTEAIDGLTLGWPPLASIGAMEFQALSMGLDVMIKMEIMTRDEARSYGLSQIDMPVQSANKDYLPTLAKEKARKIKPKPKKAATDDDQNTQERKIAAMASNAQEFIEDKFAAGPIDFSFSPQP